MYLYDRAGNRYLTANEIAIQERLIADQERSIANQERIAKQEAEAIASQEKIAKEQAEALLKKYRDRFGDIPE